MSQSNPQSNQCYSPDDRGNVSQTVERFVDAVDDLATALDAPESVTNEFVDAGEDLADIVEETAQQSKENGERIENNTETIEDEKDRRSAEIEGCHNRLSRLDDKIDEEPDSPTTNPTPDGSKTTIQEPETALEDVASIPEHLVDDSLTANQRRARFVAIDVEEYSRSVPAGRAIKSSELRRILSAGTDETIYNQTVSRVIDYLDELGGDDVKIRETRSGERAVIFEDDLVERLNHHIGNGVVTDERVRAA